MIAYKGFCNDLTCTHGRGRYQYREGVWIEESRAQTMSTGLHCAENPLDCLRYYSDWEKSAYYEVEAEGDLDENGQERDSQIAATRIRLVQRLDKAGFAMAVLEYIYRHPTRYIENVTLPWIRVKGEMVEAPEDGIAITYGANPSIKGPEGSILAMVKIQNGKAVGAGIQKVDGVQVRADRWYCM